MDNELRKQINDLVRERIREWRAFPHYTKRGITLVWQTKQRLMRDLH